MKKYRIVYNPAREHYRIQEWEHYGFLSRIIGNKGYWKTLRSARVDGYMFASKEEAETALRKRIEFEKNDRYIVV